MAAFVVDTFTDTNGTLITAHTPDTGGTWTKHGSSFSGPTPTIQSNRYDTGTSLYDNYYNDATPPSADYFAEVDIINLTGSGSNGQGIAVRQSTAASLTCYMLRLTGTGVLFQKHVSNVATTLGSHTYSFGGGDWYVKLQASGTTITCWVQKISTGEWLTTSGLTSTQTPIFSVTDSAVTGAGHPAIISWSSATHFDNFTADEPIVDLTESVTSTLSLVSTATASGVLSRSATNTLSLASTGAAELLSSIIPATSTLALIQQADHELIENDRVVASNTLELTSTAFSLSNPGVAQGLALTQEATAFLFTVFGVESTLNLSQSATAVKGVPWLPIQVSHTLELEQSLIRSIAVSVESTLSLTSEADWSYGIESTLALTQSAVAGVNRPLESELNIVQAVSKAGSIWQRSVSSALSLTSAGNSYNPNDKCAIRRGTRRGPTPNKMQLTLRSMDGSKSVTLRNPEQDNIRRVSFERIVRETRGGELTVFSDPSWPTIQSLLFTVVSTKAATIESLIQFIQDTLGEEIILTDWLGEQFVGVVIRPDEPFVEDREGYWTFGFEFEGYKSASHITVQNLNLTSTASAVVV